ncbi:hypothetical protein C8R47DRAFT_1217639 [Mycena vitilis]|nr:hypothetical protein C8R47DRAFT_1217639 [Mycena vitilis]
MSLRSSALSAPAVEALASLSLCRSSPSTVLAITAEEPEIWDVLRSRFYPLFRSAMPLLSAGIAATIPPSLYLGIGDHGAPGPRCVASLVFYSRPMPGGVTYPYHLSSRPTRFRGAAGESWSGRRGGSVAGMLLT